MNANARRVLLRPRAVAGRELSLFSSVLGLRNDPRRHREQRVVPFPSELVYKVVSDVPRYKEFVPYTQDSFVSQWVSDSECVAELKVGFMALNERYRSRVKLDPDAKSVRAAAEDSALFHVLTNAWRMRDRPQEAGTCELEFELEFQFRSSLYGSAADMFFNKVTASMVDAFLRRCEQMRPEYEAELRARPAAPMAASLPPPPEDALFTFSPPLEEDFGTSGVAPVLSSGDARVLGELASLSHFDVRELERIKRDFDAARSGSDALSLDRFCALFQRLFARGGHAPEEVRRSAALLFRALDNNRDGALSLREVAAGLSTVMRGAPQEKCRFWFRCFGVGADGRVGREQLAEMVRASMEVREALAALAVAMRQPGHGKVTVQPRVDERAVEQAARAVVERCFRERGVDRQALSLQDLVDRKLF